MCKLIQALIIVLFIVLALYIKVVMFCVLVLMAMQLLNNNELIMLLNKKIKDNK